jgi:hypothetical protein
VTILPVRLRLSRAKGFDLQATSRALNGLPAKSVARPGPWGNPFPWRGDWITWAAVAAGFRADESGRIAAAAAYHRAWLAGGAPRGPLADHKTQDSLEFENGHCVDTATHARELAAAFANGLYPLRIAAPPKIDLIYQELAGRNLACWCALDAPCHADTLLEFANPTGFAP